MCTFSKCVSEYDIRTVLVCIITFLIGISSFSMSYAVKNGEILSLTAVMGGICIPAELRIDTKRETVSRSVKFSPTQTSS